MVSGAIAGSDDCDMAATLPSVRRGIIIAVALNVRGSIALHWLAPLLVGGCVYDWEVGEEDGVGGVGGATNDASSTAQTGGAGGAGGGEDCGGQLASYAAALRAAKACEQTDPGVCGTAFSDLCGCTTYIAHEGTPEAEALVSARDALDPTVCGVTCGTCPSVPVLGACSPDLEHGGVSCSP